MSSTPATASKPECTVIVPVYRNAGHIPALLERLAGLNEVVAGGIEAVLVVDGSPDESHARLLAALPDQPFKSQLLSLSRNFGSFAAIRAGLESANGRYFAVMAADLQEPAELVTDMLAALREDRADVVVGTRTSRRDPLSSRLAARLFWSLNRRLVEGDIPSGGVDVFGCNLAFRKQLLQFSETHSSLIGQLFWLGFRRLEIPYNRQASLAENSGWSLGAKFKYFLDSLFAFTDVPIRAFLILGLLGLLTSLVLLAVIVTARLTGAIDVPGYAATATLIVFFSGLNLFGLGVIGSYVWRAYENTKQRPQAVVMDRQSFSGDG
jgi:polyisoprenyl-phosphate glycosyltransferase